MTKKLFFLSLALVLLGWGCRRAVPAHTPAVTTPPSATQTESDVVSTDYFTFSDPKKNLSFTVSNVPLSDLFTAESLTNQNAACDTRHSYQYYQTLAAQFGTGLTAKQFTFGNWSVVIVPNKPGYKTIDAFKEDFAVCGAYGTLYPAQISAKNILFTSACPTNKKTATTDAACAKARDEIEKTLKIK